MSDERKHPLARCEDCTLKGRPFTPIYLPEANGFRTRYKCLFVGQAPGQVESDSGRPFTGPAGKQHFSCLMQAGLSQLEYPHTNTCACWPPRDSTGRDRKPSTLETACCLSRLTAEIQELKPKLIVALGEPAMKTLTGLTGIKKHMGQFADLAQSFDWECKVLCALHPSFVMQSRQWIPSQVKTYELISAFFQGRLKRERELNLILDPSKEELQAFLSEETLYACDTETTGLDTLGSDDILGHSFAKNGSEACALYYVHDDPRWEVVCDFLKDPKRTKCWQNGPFDTEFIRSQGVIDEGYVFDTMLAQQLLQSDLPADLDFLRTMYTDIKPYKPTKKQYKRLLNLGKDRVLELAALDALTTYAVMEEQQKLLGEKQMKLMHELLIPLVRAIGRIERRGFLVDQDMLGSLYMQCGPVVDELESYFYGECKVNPRSPKKLKEYFNIKDTREDTLNYHIKRRHPKAEDMQLLLKFREVDGLQSKYLVGVHKRLREGRIHSHFKVDGTGTGRLSSRNPNLQNVPDEMRAVYIPDPGYILVQADYSQIELWCGAAIVYMLFGDDSMLRDLQSGEDIHYIAAQMCFPEVKCLKGTRKEDFTHRQSNIAKSITFGTFYGRTPMSIAREFAVTKAEAERWQIKLINRYPGIKQYYEYCESETRQKGFLETPFGRTRQIISRNQGYNFPVQSSASDITLGSIILMDGLGIEVLASVHDSVIFQIPNQQFKKQMLETKEVMERPIPEFMNMSFKVEYETGPNWYEVKKFNPLEL